MTKKMIHQSIKYLKLLAPTTQECERGGASRVVERGQEEGADAR